MILIGLSGLKRSGKSTVARYLVEQYGFAEVSFAGPLKRGLATMLDMDLADLEREDLKEQPLDWLGKSPRQMLQTLGTQWGRQLVNDQIWILIAARAIERHRNAGAPGVVASDVRFDNEADFIHLAGGETWLITRPVRPVAAGDRHESERGISEHLVDRCIVNARGFPQLHQRVDELLAPHVEPGGHAA